MEWVDEEFFELNSASLSQDGGIVSKFLCDNPFVGSVLDSKLICKSRNNTVWIISSIWSRYEARSAEAVNFVCNRLSHGGFPDSRWTKNVKHPPTTPGVDNPMNNFSSQSFASLWMALWWRISSR